MKPDDCGNEIASIRAAIGEKIVGRQLECGRTAFQLYIYDDESYLKYRILLSIDLTYVSKKNKYIIRVATYISLATLVFTYMEKSG